MKEHSRISGLWFLSFELLMLPSSLVVMWFMWMCAWLQMKWIHSIFQGCNKNTPNYTPPPHPPKKRKSNEKKVRCCPKQLVVTLLYIYYYSQQFSFHFFFNGVLQNRRLSLSILWDLRMMWMVIEGAAFFRGVWTEIWYAHDGSGWFLLISQAQVGAMHRF